MMRFIAVFNQLHTTSSIGFDTLIDANDFLFWGYEDKDLIPHGIYDILTAKATLYDHVGQLMESTDTETIRRFAVEYLSRIRQHVAYKELV